MGNLTAKLAQLTQFESERLIMRHAIMADAQDMYELLREDDVIRWIHAPQLTSVSQAAEESIAGYHLSNPLGKYVIIERVSNKMIGGVDIRLNEANDAAEIGYMLNTHYWGQGYMTEAGTALIQQAFALGIHRIEGRHAPLNTASGRVMQRVGMTREGVLRDAEKLPNGEYVDNVIYGIINSNHE